MYDKLITPTDYEDCVSQEYETLGNKRLSEKFCRRVRKEVDREVSVRTASVRRVVARYLEGRSNE